MLGLSFKAPAPTTYENYLTHIDEKMIGDSPVAFGLHPNAEIGFRTDQANHLFKTITGIIPATSSGDDEDDGAAKNPQMIADALVQDISEAYRETVFDMDDILGNMDDPGPFQNVFLQECETMNGLLGQMRYIGRT